MAFRPKNECISGLNVSIIRRQSPRFKSGRMSILRVSGDGQGFDGGCGTASIKKLNTFLYNDL